MKQITAQVIVKIKNLLIQDDKQKHFMVCFVLTIVSLPFIGLIYSILFASLVGLFKEIWDHYYGSGFCWYDMLANGLGIILALLCYFILLII